ncbi:hypothetical protein PSI9734_00710 [Pseudidiomarina piscicola]|uniref:DUF2569 domain-containing protein n=1 Tax=Pseudidiomarina piscicola TaxID=2614830 RepID=A0A6S6WN42_9GAMM|nr:DUF2569 domain-containing protein [Pseudidiomarina piscicola]CAB0150143.1 hypothetical protein PSI9734_00710 [Pseudidiomarina piscicola]VZT39582.1 hypothetical protein PSI9734_00710 [Pseudomonas aeruginosa]
MTKAATDGTGNELKGIAGWLYLVALGVVVSPIRVFIDYYPMLNDYFSGAYDSLTTNPNAKSYIPHFETLIKAELIGNALILILAVGLAVLFFSKHRWFPRTYIFLAAFTPIFLVTDLWMAATLIPGAEVLNSDMVGEIVRSLLAACIWIPYMLVSKRVNNTFRRQNK